jgi:DNA-directed RNA polymerase sigma subunit (sigma70/sigma32)
MKEHDIKLLTDANLGDLLPREQTIMRLHYGLDGTPRTLKDIAAAFGVTTATIGQWEAHVWLKLEHRAQMMSGRAHDDPTASAH